MIGKYTLMRPKWPFFIILLENLQKIQSFALLFDDNTMIITV